MTNRSPAFVIALTLLALASDMPYAVSETAQQCRDRAAKCQRQRMGNDTPSERVNCRKVCPDAHTCGAATGAGITGTRFNPGTPPPSDRLPFALPPAGAIIER